jgi:hypothetical protein
VLLSLEYTGYPLSYTPLKGVLYGVWDDLPVFDSSFWVCS